MAHQDTERRRTPRLDTRSPVLVHLEDLESLTTTRDLSLGGCRFLHMTPLGRGTPLNLVIRVDGCLVQASGRIVFEQRNADEIYEVGVEFLSIPDEDRRRIERLFAKQE
jgi:c-di-GMP-binding flagellar brake protein YcgR